MLRPSAHSSFTTFFGLIEWALFPFIGDCHVMADDSGSGFFAFHRESGEWWGLGLHIVADSLRLAPSLG